MFPLLTARLSLRPFIPSDAAALLDAIQESLETVGRWLPWCVPHYDLSMTQSWIMGCEQQRREGSAFDLVINDRNTGHLLGSIAINNISKAYRLGNVGYWIRQSVQGQGLITEAMREVVPFGFGTLGLTRLEIIAAEENHASRQVAEKVGAHFEGLLRNRIIIHDQPVTAALYSLIPGDELIN
ncbi:GNAT family N-acetyltransferase [Dickeya poaceiphila]|uniref:GNAT family N-acetyltransferase n=1 Tax=Dickeya poaceiphila TaxID=568768 RepID=A0A5B8I7F7_9GAMM|nr:GNAT family N-acetyltransferase [Dickeya poaceiphila]QDX29828.1 GNAT family N-acetyltransferase [Dickeya poaceiphila]